MYTNGKYMNKTSKALEERLKPPKMIKKAKRSANRHCTRNTLKP